MKTIKEKLTPTSRFQPAAFWCLAGIFILLLLGYAYFVNMAVYHVVERGSLEGERTKLSASLSEQESSYLALKNRVTLAFASERGFTETGVARFISKKTHSVIVAVNNEL